MNSATSFLSHFIAFAAGNFFGFLVMAISIAASEYEKRNDLSGEWDDEDFK